MFDPKKHKDDYKDQSNRVKIVSGTYDVVGSKTQVQTVGANKTEKLRVFATVLSVVEAEDQKAATSLVGKFIPVDIWWDKPGNDGHKGCNLLIDAKGALQFSGKRLMNLIMANRHEEDVTDKVLSRNVVDLVTGTPFRLRVEVRERTWTDDNGTEHKSDDVDVVEVRHLASGKVKTYKERPDFEKIVPPKMADRVLEPFDTTAKRGKDGGSSKSKKSDDEASVASDDDDFFGEDFSI